MNENVISFRPRCAVPGCPNRVSEPWEETGRLCPRCAVETELFDREARFEVPRPLPREVRPLHR
jgi:hypothetical protein